jgi:AraC-like DNA-binding protein
MDTRIESVLRIIARDPAIPIGDLAAAVNLSGSRLRHLFRSCAGASLSRYATAAKMDKARTLLDGSFLNGKEVMHAIGYSDPTHFIRIFKRHFGTTPAKYRARASRYNAAKITEE